MSDSYHLILDEVRPRIFDAYMSAALKSLFVIGEMYFGDSHTTAPQTWLDKFTGYEKYAFTLQASPETCFARANRPDHEPKFSSLEQYKHEILEGHLQDRNDFPAKVRMIETPIDTEGKSRDEIADEVYKVVFGAGRDIRLLQPKLNLLYYVYIHKKVRNNATGLSKSRKYSGPSWTWENVQELLKLHLLRTVDEQDGQYLKITRQGRRILSPITRARAFVMAIAGLALVPAIWGIEIGFLNFPPLTPLALLLSGLLLMLFAWWLARTQTRVERRLLGED